MESLSRRSLGRFGTVSLARGQLVIDRGSSFVAWVVWPITSEDAAYAAVALLRQQEPSADHVMSAYRVVLPASKKVVKGHDDDGETHGGQRLLGCLTKEKVTDAAVVVARVWGGVNLGKARFEHIQERARLLLHAAGHRAGQGIRHDWGEGKLLGGEMLDGESSRSSQPRPQIPVSGRKRKRGLMAVRDEMTARRDTMAAAAELRLSQPG
mmetsp:Transcript_15142/g.32924  ORF Transcript_15142/g.32924 Transcript_15142/m.32924 type:complete len:210 (-) Transcript_15142:247-876(-)|eukprot:CAMPEP_0183356586 /NCGR_PEP_ID=MMETSP0164_2-20130417/44970_1 /TAXON_ID=221442 /ORGANISM="Coccolithus pelagicus ssp braarudi, Strain PLY182g" /LENGTH=209 /DNA_ID=CAMNT_0025530047 /DNA_START=18 /DNA_END=647 /DNA_ORIENTATION=+